MAYYAVSTSAIRHNLAVIRKAAGERTVWAVLKCDGYGLGLAPMAALCREEGITHFAVTEPDDALALRENALEGETVLLLRPESDEVTLQKLCLAGVVLTVASQQDALLLSGAASSVGLTARAHLKIDTGMGRYGFLPSQAEEILSCLTNLEHIDFCGVYTHFARAFCSNSFTLLQAERLTLVCEAIRRAGKDVGEVHAGNSAALFRCPEACQDGVRVGSAILGRLPFSTPLKRVGVCRAELTNVRWLPKGATFGYGSAYCAKKPVRIAVLPVGWYHGFTLAPDADTFRLRDSLRRILHHLRCLILPPCLTVTVAGKKCRVLGHVGMCHTTIDVTNVDPKPGETALVELNPTRLRGLPVCLED